jgi:hypothetical protein
MFRSSTIIRGLELNLAKVIFMLKHSVKLRRYLLCGYAATQLFRGNNRAKMPEGLSFGDISQNL